jgi:hypothetical protein
MFWWRRSYRPHTAGAQEPVERGEEFLECAIQFLAKCFGFEAPVTRSHFSLHQAQKSGVTMLFVVGEVLHFAILGLLRTETFGTHFSNIIFWPVRHNLVRISTGNLNREDVRPS